MSVKKTKNKGDLRSREWPAEKWSGVAAKFYYSVVEATSQNKNIDYSLFERLRSIQDGNRKDQLAELPLRRL